MLCHCFCNCDVLILRGFQLKYPFVAMAFNAIQPITCIQQIEVNMLQCKKRNIHILFYSYVSVFSSVEQGRYESVNIIEYKLHS